jgi:hypothetical protein
MNNCVSITNGGGRGEGVIQLLIVSVDPETSGKNDSNVQCTEILICFYSYLKMEIRLNINNSTL